MSYLDRLDDATRARIRERWESGMERADDDCACLMCMGRRSFNAYQRVGTEPNWDAVRFWRARQEWLENAPRTERRLRPDA